jgi:hypothetical protein
MNFLAIPDVTRSTKPAFFPRLQAIYFKEI